MLNYTVSKEPPKFSRLQATVVACEMFMQATIRVLREPGCKSAAISAAAVPFFAIDFSKEAVLQIGNYKLSCFLNRLRGSLLNRAQYRCLVAHISNPLIDESIVFYPQLEDWRIVIAWYNLTERLTLPDWIPILNHLAASLICQPRDLSLWSHAEISQLALASPEAAAIMGLYNAALVHCAPPKSATPESSWQLMASAHALAAGLRVSSVAETIPARAQQAANAAIDLPDDFDSMGPAAKIRCLAGSTADNADIYRFLNTGAQVNILHQVQDSLKSVASGIQCYASFCDLLQVPYFPPATETILRWSSLFSPGRSFGQYLSHVSKACQLMNLPLNWITPAIRGVAKGLANAQDISFRFDNFIQKEPFFA